MLKDYKKLPKESVPAEGTGFGRGLLVGLAIGMVMAAIVHVYHTRQQAATSAYTCETDTQPVQVASHTETNARNTAADCELRDSDMHKVLVDSKVPMPDWKLEYILQVKSHRTQKEAEMLKQRILDLGYKSKISQSKENGELWYRIEIGPYREPGDVNKVQQHLKRYRIESMIKKQNSKVDK